MRVSGIVDFYSPSLPTISIHSIDSKRIASLKRSFGALSVFPSGSIDLSFQEGRHGVKLSRIVFRRARYRVDRITFTFREYVNNRSKNISFESFLVKSIFFFSFVKAQIALERTKSVLSRIIFANTRSNLHSRRYNVHSSMQSSRYFTLK